MTDARGTLETADERAEARRRVSYAPLLVFVMLVVVLTSKSMLTRLLVMEDSSSFPGLALEAAFVASYVGVIDLIFSRRRLVAHLVGDAVASIGLAGIALYAAYYDQLIIPAALRLVSEIPSMSSSLWQLLTPAYLFYLIDLPLLAWLASRPDVRAATNGTAYRIPIAIVTAASVVVASSVMGIVIKTSPNEDRVAAARSKGLFGYETLALVWAVRGESPVREVSIYSPRAASGQPGQSFADNVKVDPSNREQVEAAAESILQRRDAARHGSTRRAAFRGSNLIVIQVESLQDFVIGLEVGDEEITPNLNDMVDESWYFPNAFSQTGPGSTSDAEFIVNTSLYPPTQEPASVAYQDRTIPSLPRLLEKQKYSTFAMHANDVAYWNRSALYGALGFGDYYDDTFFGRDRLIGLGTSDRTLFRKAYPELMKKAADGRFYAHIVTLSPQYPFDLPESTQRLDLPDWLKDTVVGDYLQAMNYEDRQIGWFVEQLKESGIWDESVVVVYGDHGGLPNADLDEGDVRARLEKLIGHAYTPADRTNVPVIIHLPGQKEGIVSRDAVGQVDIMPTAADLLGLDLTGVPQFGRSMFEDSRIILAGRSGLPPGSFINNRIICLAGPDFDNSEALDLKKRTPTALLRGEGADWAAAQDLLELSDAYARNLPERSRSTSPTKPVIPVRRPSVDATEPP